MTTRSSAGEPDAAVAGLAREVETLRRQVDDLPALREQVTELAALVARIANTLATSGTDQPAAAAPPSWLAFPTDPDNPQAAAEEARELLAGLADWVRDVYLRYDDGVGRFPDCWLWHPTIVEELLALWSAWRAAYAPGAPAAAAADWHDRHRPMTTRRIRDSAAACSLDAHRVGNIRRHPAPDVPHADAIDAIAHWWTTNREQPGPAPSEQQLARRAQYWRLDGRSPQ